MKTVAGVQRASQIITSLFAVIASMTSLAADQASIVESSRCSLRALEAFNKGSDHCKQLEHTRPVDANAKAPIRVLSLHTPFKIAPIAARSQVSIEYGAGNTWSPNITLWDQSGMQVAAPSAPMMGNGAVLKEPPTAFRAYGARGVIRSGRIRMTTKLSETDELDFALNMNMLVSGASPIDALVGDRFIEWFHDRLGLADPFQRGLNGLNQDTHIHFGGENGKEYTLEAGELFLGTFDFGNTKYFELVNGDKVLVTVQLGVFGGIPLNSFNGGIAVGGSAGAAGTFRLSEQSSLTAAANAAVQHDNVIRVREGTGFQEHDLTKSYRFLLAYNKDFQSGSRLSCGFELQGTSAPIAFRPLEDGNRWGALTPGYYSKDKPASEQKVTRATQELSYRALTNWNEYITGFVSYRPGDAKTAPTISLYLQEDWRLFHKDGLAGAMPSFGKASNAQDFGAGAKVEVPFDIGLPGTKKK